MGGEKNTQGDYEHAQTPVVMLVPNLCVSNPFLFPCAVLALPSSALTLVGGVHILPFSIVG